jgi:catechol 2,3-dioxygenase-like lactoylglutathione lyase family enzyme
MKITGLGWVGTRTSQYQPMVAFLKDVLGLTPHVEEDGFALFRLPNGDTIEVFGDNDEHHRFFTTGPVVGFRVADVPAAQAEMETAGIEFLGRPASSSEGYAWSHFRAPDGNVYEIMSSPEATT